MNIRELIEQLEELATEHGDECDVRLAWQPSYPLEAEIGRIEAVNLTEEIEDAAERAEAEVEAMPIVYIGQGSGNGYLPGAAASQLGWR